MLKNPTATPGQSEALWPETGNVRWGGFALQQTSAENVHRDLASTHGLDINND
jgi:hypothetical protein